MAFLHKLAVFVLLLIPALGATGVAEDPPNPRTSDRVARRLQVNRDRYHASPRVTALAISDDGRRIAATYYVPAMNRSGNDWSTFARTWDLETGEQIEINGATHPLVLAGDGRIIVMGLNERTNRRSRFADCRLAVWKFGRQKPTRVLDREIKIKVDDDKETKAVRDRGLPRSRRSVRDDVSAVPSVRTVALLSNNRVLAGYSDGSLRLWRTDGLEGNENALLNERDPDESLQAIGGMITNILTDGPRYPELVTLFPDENFVSVDTIRRREKPVDQQLAQVRVLNDRFLQVETMAPDDATVENALTSDHGTKAFGEMQRYIGPLKRELVKRIWPFAGTPELNVYPDAMVAKRGTWAAISARGRVWIVNGYKRVDHVVPFGGGVVGASHNVLFLAVADADQSIRVWDVRKRRLVRTFASQLNEEPQETFTVAALQSAVEFGNPEQHRERLVEEATIAAREGARIIVLPEAAVTGYFDAAQNRTWHVPGRPLGDGLQGVDPADVAETVPGPSTVALGKVARKFGVYITVPILEVDRRTGRYYNSVVLLGPDDQQLIHYRKREPWPKAEESWASPGNLGNPVVDTPFGRLGVLISHDLLQHAAAIEDQHVDILLCPLAWVEEEEGDWFEKRLPEIARQHKLTIVAANWGVSRIRSTEQAPAWHGYGQSRIIASDGTILAKLPAAANRASRERITADLPLPENPVGE